MHSVYSAHALSSCHVHTVGNASYCCLVTQAVNNLYLMFSWPCPQAPQSFQCSTRKDSRGNLVKFITCVMSDGTNFHIWHSSTLASLRHRISHRKFELFNLNVTIGYESASRGLSDPSLGVENCDSRGNSIVPLSRPSWFHLGLDTIE